MSVMLAGLLAAGALALTAAVVLRERHDDDESEYPGAQDDEGTQEWLVELAGQHRLMQYAEPDPEPEPGTDEWWVECSFRLIATEPERFARELDARVDAVVAAKFGPDWVAAIAAADEAQRAGQVQLHRYAALAMEHTGEMPRVLVGVA